MVAARAILGEWLGGSGGGWQDSGGIWPGLKMIEGQLAGAGDAEVGISRGRLLPDHHIYTEAQVSREIRQSICDSFVLVHGGMAQNVGPVLEMVTEKYLLRCEAEWTARQEAIGLLRSIETALCRGDLRQLAESTSRNFFGPLQTIIPWASNHYTETLIRRAREHFASDYWGFLMLGGISGGGMGFIVAPVRKTEAQNFLRDLMQTTKRELQYALPFAMEPVVYDFVINNHGTMAALWQGGEALMPAGYYAICASDWLRRDVHQLSPAVRNEIAHFAANCRTHPRLKGSTELLLGTLFPQPTPQRVSDQSLEKLLDENGFDPELHEQIRADLRTGRIGLAQNRLPASTVVEDVELGDVIDCISDQTLEDCRRRGETALAAGEVAAMALAAGAGSRWTQGAGVVKALHPFCRFQGAYRNFIEIHLAKARRVARLCGTEIPYVISTSYLTHEPIEEFVASRASRDTGSGAMVLLSPGRSVGLRMVPMARDLRFAWEEVPHQILDLQAQKVSDSLHAALISWAESAGGGSDYTDNVPLQSLHPTGHWFEVPNLLRNGTLARLLTLRPQLKYLWLHNIDTLGADLDASILGRHMSEGGCLTFEVIPRRIDDRGGGLARINGSVRLVEGLAMPREQDEFRLRYYNAMSTWITIDRLLEVFGLNRGDLGNEPRVTSAIRRLSMRLPTYITLKDVKKRWGHGQEDVFPVAQFEKLWSDMTDLTDLECRFVTVPRFRGQQLEEPAQLDAWLRDGSAAYVNAQCAWE